MVEPDYKTLYEMTKAENQRLVQENGNQHSTIEMLKTQIAVLYNISIKQ
jgi:hypothetical protein